MGRMTKKLSRKPQKPLLPYAMPAPFRNLQAEASVLTNVVVNKLGANALTAQEREDTWVEGYQEGFAEAISAAANVLLNDWGYLVMRKVRLAEFYCRLQRYRRELDPPSEQQLKAEAEFTKQTGLKMGRVPRDANL